MHWINRLMICALISCFYFILNSQPVSFTHTRLLNTVSGFTVYSDCAVDMNGDQLDDVVRIGAKGLFIDFQRPDGSFTLLVFPIAIQSPPEWSVCAGDLDNNGFNDLLFADTETVSFVKANQDGTAYSESVMPSFLISQRSTMADIDNDGWLDAFVCNDTSMSIPFRNDGAGNMTPDTNLIHTASYPGSYSAIWTDYDNDNDIDLYISKCLSGAAPGNIVRTNLLYRNDGNGNYSEVGALAGVDDNAQSWSTVFEDFDNDGDMDAFVINHDFQNRLYRNNGNGTFTDVIGASGIEGLGADVEENAAGDFNNDGFVDIFSELSSELYLGNGDLTFVGQDAPSAPGAIADLNNDGFLDVTRNSQVWLNNGNTENHWLKVVPFGLVGNRNGIGARVEIYGAWGIQIRDVRSGQSYSPMSSLTVHFGLGENTIVDSLKIRWPSGIVTVVKDLLSDATYLVPEAECLLPLPSSEHTRIELCSGDSATLVAPAGYAHYFWSNGDTTQTTRVWDTGKYFALLTDTQGCVALTNYSDILRAHEISPSISAEPGRRLCQGDTMTLVASPGQNHVWSNGMQGERIIVTESGNYTVAVDAKCSTDQLSSSPFEVEFLPAVPPTVFDVSVGAGDSILLSAEGENCHWYDEPTGGNLLHVGSEYQTPVLDEDIVYYIESRPYYQGEIQSGGKADTTFSGGVSLQTGFMFFEAWEPFTLLSVRVYLPEGAPDGLRFVQLFSPDTLLAFKQFQLVTGWNELDLNFEVPVGTFSLHCPLGNLFRDVAPLDYPYPIGDAGQITTSAIGSDYYYYFYDWKIQKRDVECISERVPVHVTVTGTELLTRYDGIEIYPNPTLGELTIDMKNPRTSDGFLCIFDANSIAIRRQKIPETTIFTIDISGLAPGVYWLQIQEGVTVTNKKIALLSY